MKRTLWNIVFPLSYSEKFELSDKDREYINSLYGEALGEEIVAIEYELKTGRDLLGDTLIGSLVGAICFVAIIVPIIMLT